jgi:hypothetical protein
MMGLWRLCWGGLVMVGRRGLLCCGGRVSFDFWVVSTRAERRTFGEVVIGIMPRQKYENECW